jgi:hypothetical protein
MAVLVKPGSNSRSSRWWRQQLIECMAHTVPTTTSVRVTVLVCVALQSGLCARSPVQQRQVLEPCRV